MEEAMGKEKGKIIHGSLKCAFRAMASSRLASQGDNWVHELMIEADKIPSWEGKDPEDPVDEGKINLC